MELNEQQLQRRFDLLMNYVNNASGYDRHSGVRITKIAPNYCEGELTITPECCNYLGIVHGGCLATLADTVAGTAACSTGRGTVTINYGLNFLRQATGSVIKCVAEPEKTGKTISVFRCSLTNDRDELVASGQFTFFMDEALGAKLMEECTQASPNE